MRFKDDILIILGGTRVSRLNFFTSLREQSSVWSLEVESVRFSACNYLDLNIAKGAKWRSSGLLDVGIHHKPTGLHQPLAPHSAHSPHVHVAWPKGLLTRAKRLCNTKSLFHLEVLHLNGCSLQGLARLMQMQFYHDFQSNHPLLLAMTCHQGSFSHITKNGSFAGFSLLHRCKKDIESP